MCSPGAAPIIAATRRFQLRLSPSHSYHPTFSAGGVSAVHQPGGLLSSNGYGRCDMAGNVWQLCWYGTDATWFANVGATHSDPGAGGYHFGFESVEGGAWYDYAGYARCCHRGLQYPSNARSQRCRLPLHEGALASQQRITGLAGQGLNQH